MKKNALLLIFSLLALSCSSDDENTSVENNVSTGDYLPLSNSNYWVYDVEGTTLSGRDSLYIYGDVTVNDVTYKQFLTDELPIGFLSSALNNNSVRKQDDRLLLSGSAMINFIQDFPMSIDLEDFTILKENANNGQVIGTATGMVPYQYEEYTFNFNYTLTSTSMGDVASYTVPGGETYTDVKAVQTTLNLAVNTLISAGNTTIPVTIMPAQNVVVSTRYFAKDIGVVHTTTDIHYELSNLTQFGIELPLPQSMTDEQEEILVNYEVQ